jgi:hypothetical protein
MLRQHATPFFDALIAAPQVQGMWNVRNGGVPVFVHTIDVALLALDALPDWQDRHGPMNLVALLTGALLHDLTKVTARATRGQPTHLSHSAIMLVDPMAAVVEAQQSLAYVREATGTTLDKKEMALVGHIIMSHHGQWGAVAPRCPEAALVHACDLHSARFYRQPPIDANDVLQLLDTGISRTAAARVLGVTPQLVAKRLQEALRAEWLDSVDDLLSSWRRRGYVVAGDEEAIAQRQHIRRRADEATRAPAPLIEHATFVSWLGEGD